MKTHVICATFERNCNPAVQHSLIPRNETFTFMTSSSGSSTRQTACTGPQPSMFPLAFFTAKRTPSFQRNISGGLSPKSTDVRNHVALETCFPFCDIAASTAIFFRSFELRIFMRVRVQRYQTAPRVQIRARRQNLNSSFEKKMDASASSEATICELEAHGSLDASAVTECELEDLDTTITELTPEYTSTPIACSSKSRIRGMCQS